MFFPLGCVGASFTGDLVGVKKSAFAKAEGKAYQGLMENHATTVKRILQISHFLDLIQNLKFTMKPLGF